MLMDEGIYTARGNSNIANGIAKVNQYLQPMEAHLNPITGTTYGSHIYISDELQFVIDEFNGYYWKSDNVGDRQDIPIDKDDHAMNTIKYMLSHVPEIAVVLKVVTPEDLGWRRWGERDIPQQVKDSRHG
jgi:hypothetical protein